MIAPYSALKSTFYDFFYLCIYQLLDQKFDLNPMGPLEKMSSVLISISEATIKTKMFAKYQNSKE